MGAKMKRLILFLTLLPALAWSQSYPLFKPANGILKGQTTTYVTTAAAASDVISLWSGSCSSTTFLRGDGSCQAPGGAGIGTVTSVDVSFTGSGISVAGGPITSAGTLALSGTLNVATGGTGATTLTGLLEGSGTSAINPAEVADVITLWTGTCDATTFLRGDGSCQTVAGTTDASTLTTGTLADARLSSNVVLESLANVFTNATQTISASGANLIVNDTAGGTNTKAGRLIHTGNNLLLQGCNDALSTCSNALSVTHSGAGATIDIVNITGTAVNVNGNAALTSASTLNGSNVGTGTVADARLSSNVALKNVADQNFSVVGNNRVTVENTSTGQALLTLRTNGINRAYLCTNTIAGNCVIGSAANDSVIRSTQTLRVSTDDGASSQAVISTAQIDLNATVVNANSSRINTVANSGKLASGFFSDTGTFIDGVNVTGTSRTSTGIYSVDLTAAGFASRPHCTATPATAGGLRYVTVAVSVTGPAFTVTLSTYNSASTLADVNVMFICHGP